MHANVCVYIHIIDIIRCISYFFMFLVFFFYVPGCNSTMVFKQKLLPTVSGCCRWDSEISVMCLVNCVWLLFFLMLKNKVLYCS